MPSIDVDEGSRFHVPKPVPKMHAKCGDDPAILEARKEARRLSARSQAKWIEAAERNEMVRMQQLLDDGQDINEMCYPGGQPALYIAARTNNLRLAEMLLKRGADPSVLTDDLVSPVWIAVSRGFDQMVELLLEKEWSGKLVEKLKTESSHELSKTPDCGIQHSHYDLAVMRRYWRCVHHIESALGVSSADSKIPAVFYEPPSGWAIGYCAAEAGQRPDMPVRPFYWKAFTKEACRDDPPEGSKKMEHQGQGIFKETGTVGA